MNKSEYKKNSKITHTKNIFFYFISLAAVTYFYYRKFDDDYDCWCCCVFFLFVQTCIQIYMEHWHEFLGLIRRKSFFYMNEWNIILTNRYALQITMIAFMLFFSSLKWIDDLILKLQSVVCMLQYNV